jgi:hypothetical protein
MAHIPYTIPPFQPFGERSGQIQHTTDILRKVARAADFADLCKKCAKIEPDRRAIRRTLMLASKKGFPLPAWAHPQPLQNQ